LLVIKFNKYLKMLDARIPWGIRFLIYKLFAARLDGFGYLGKPSFVKGLKNFYAGPGLGIFPGWRIEILNGAVYLGRNVRIGNNFFLNCGSQVLIGDDVTISSNVFIGTTDVEISPDLEMSFKDWNVKEKPIFIGNGCFIGYGAVILPGVKLGDGCVVGANTVVRGQYIAGTVIAGQRIIEMKTRL
jgi:acetyltransferase-like isoleucine patch superfamily enzyme